MSQNTFVQRKNKNGGPIWIEDSAWREGRREESRRIREDLKVQKSVSGKEMRGSEEAVERKDCKRIVDTKAESN